MNKIFKNLLCGSLLCATFVNLASLLSDAFVTDQTAFEQALIENIKDNTTLEEYVKKSNEDDPTVSEPVTENTSLWLLLHIALKTDPDLLDSFRNSLIDGSIQNIYEKSSDRLREAILLQGRFIHDPEYQNFQSLGNRHYNELFSNADNFNKYFEDKDFKAMMNPSDDRTPLFSLKFKKTLRDGSIKKIYQKIKDSELRKSILQEAMYVDPDIYFKLKQMEENLATQA